MSRLIFINRYFFPDHSATSQILTDLAFRLRENGRDVHVITSRQVYDDPTALLPAREDVEGVTVHRIWTTRFGRSGLAKRGFDYLTFYLSAARALASIAQKSDVIVAKTDPPLLSILALPIAARRSARLINWLQDLYPEVAVELEVPLLSQLAGPIAWLRDLSLRRADCNVAICESMAERLYKLGVPRERVSVAHNWADDEGIYPLNPIENPLRSELGLTNKFIVGYSGNLGRAHEFETLLAAAQDLHSHHEITFIVIGGGKQLDLLRTRVDELGLSESFRFLSYQPRERLRHSLTLADVHWVSMRPQMEGLLFPSKLFGIAAAGRPILAIIDGRSEMARMIREHRCGCVIEPGDSAALTNAILRLAQDTRECEGMGQRARAMLDRNFTRAAAVRHWQDLLDAISDPQA